MAEIKKVLFQEGVTVSNPSTIPIQGLAGSDWESFTPTWATNPTGGSFTNLGGYYRRVGDTMHLLMGFEVDVGTALTGAAQIEMDIPDSLTCDTSKTTDVFNGFRVDGFGNHREAGTANVNFTFPVCATTTTMKFLGAATGSFLVWDDFPSSGADDYFSIQAFIPIVEWSGSGNFVPGALTLTEQATTPTAPSTGTEARLYLKDDKLIAQFDDSGTVRYKYLDLTGTGVTWVHTTTAP